MTDVGSHIEMLREISRKDPMYNSSTPASSPTYTSRSSRAHAVVELRSPEERAAAAAAA